MPSAFRIAAGAALVPLAVFLAGCAGSLGGRSADGPRYDYSPAAPKPNDFDRAGFGTSGLAFWMGLTPPEARALRNKDKAAAGDPAALLDLAIMASGSPRGQAGYDSIHARVDAFLARHRAHIEGRPKPYDRAKALHRLMHESFLGGTAENSPEALGYDFDQSALSGIFADRKYNCISSSLLYVILARHFGLDAEGVTLASHAFVQVRLPGGKIIEVETTTPAGFDWVHDKAFYRDRAGGFFANRGFRSTYEDYLARKIVDAYALIAYNMYNQHTHPVRMNQLDRCRLTEARAYLAPRDREAQSNRLDLYNTEYLWLKEKKDFEAAAAMFAVVAPVLSSARRDFEGDAELRNRAAWGWFEYAHALQETGRLDEALVLVDSALAAVRSEEKSGQAVRDNAISLVQIMAAGRAEKGEFAKAEAALDRHPALVRDHASFRQTRTWLYGRWASELWNREDWAGALAKFERQKETATVSDRKRIVENMVGAYTNWAVGYQDQGEWSKVRDVLAKCVDRTAAKKCRVLLDQVVAQHRMD